MYRLGDSGVHTLGDTSAFVNPAGQLLLTRRRACDTPNVVGVSPGSTDLYTINTGAIYRIVYNQFLCRVCHCCSTIVNESLRPKSA